MFDCERYISALYDMRVYWRKAWIGRSSIAGKFIILYANTYSIRACDLNIVNGAYVDGSDVAQFLEGRSTLSKQKKILLPSFRVSDMILAER